MSAEFLNKSNKAFESQTIKKQTNNKNRVYKGKCFYFSVLSTKVGEHIFFTFYLCEINSFFSKHILWVLVYVLI